MLSAIVLPGVWGWGHGRERSSLRLCPCLDKLSAACAWKAISPYLLLMLMSVFPEMNTSAIPQTFCHLYKVKEVKVCGQSRKDQIWGNVDPSINRSCDKAERHPTQHQGLHW